MFCIQRLYETEYFYKNKCLLTFSIVMKLTFLAHGGWFGTLAAACSSPGMGVRFPPKKVITKYNRALIIRSEQS